MTIFLAIIATVAIIGAITGFAGEASESESAIALGVAVFMLAVLAFAVWLIISVWTWALG